MPSDIILTALGAWILAVGLTPLVRKWAVSIGCVARPVRDRWGRRVIARLGGLPIALAFLLAVGWGTFHDPKLVGLFLGGFLMLLTGLADDLQSLHPYSKLIAQILAGCLVILTNVQVKVGVGWLIIPFTIAWLVLVINAFNLMDNMDGLSAGIGAIAASLCAWHAFQSGEGTTAVVSASLIGATLGFLRYNLPPAKIFMGDTGSQVLGLGLGTLALMGAGNHSTRLLGILAMPTLLLAVPIFDTCFVTLQRILHGRHPFQGGTDHLSHRLGILGLTTRQVVFALYALSAAFGVVSVLLASQKPLAIMGVWLLAVGVLLLVGAYLARVRVYAGAAHTPSTPTVTWIETMLLHKRRILEVGLDFILICGSYVTAFTLRFEANITGDLELLILKSLPWLISIKMLCFFFCGLYRGVWRYTSLADLVNIFRAVTLGSIFSAITLLYLWRFEGYSRAVFIIDGLILFVALSGARIAERLLNEWVTASLHGSVPVLIVGAGDTGELLLRQLRLDAEPKRRVVCFLDDDPAKLGGRIHGVPIVGTRRDVGTVVQRHRVREIHIAMRTPPSDLIQQIQGYCEENGISWRLVKAATSDESNVPPGA
ncbi:MAG: hypothetical protein HYZ90_03520 [Candidatus Omnitrophica bacterium]|nr:hypothetical protein [Candidatus Omnitrophota bacterium]